MFCLHRSCKILIQIMIMQLINFCIVSLFPYDSPLLTIFELKNLETQTLTITKQIKNKIIKNNFETYLRVL